MKRSMTIVAVVALVFSVVIAPATLAGPPEVVDEFETTFGPDPFIPFCGFDLLIETDISVRHVHHEIGRDRVQHKTWVGGEDRVYRADDPSKMVSGKWGQTDISITPEGEDEGLLRIHGVLWHLVAPGFGTVFQETGQLTLDLTLLPDDPFVSFTGKSDWATGSFDDLCAALS